MPRIKPLAVLVILVICAEPPLLMPMEYPPAPPVAEIVPEFVILVIMLPAPTLFLMPKLITPLACKIPELEIIRTKRGPYEKGPEGNSESWNPHTHTWVIKVGDSAKIIKIDVDKNRSLSDKFQIRSVPTLILFKDGKSVWRQSGVIPASTLEGIIKQYK